MPKGDDGKNKNKKTSKTSQPPKNDERTVLDFSAHEIVRQLVYLNGDKTEERKCLNTHFEEQARKLYPELGRQTYKVPGVHFNKGKTIQEKRKGQSKRLDFFEKLPMTDCDARGDRAHAFVLNMLEEMSDNFLSMGVDPLFIINSYHSDSYLYRLRSNFKTVRDDDSLPGDLDYWKKRGEMDIMVLKPGMVVFIETKSTGDNRNEWGHKTDAYEAYGKKVKAVFEQLDRYEDVFKTNMEETLRISIKTIHRVAAFPNLSLKDIEDIVQTQPTILSQDMVENPRYKLMCSDSLKSMEILTKWWLEKIEEMEDISPEEGRIDNDNTYSESDQMEEAEGLNEMRIMIGRYLGDMSMVDIYRGSQISSPFREVRRKGQAVNTTGQEFSKIALTKAQVDYINSDDVRLGYLNGPPGSGKTMVLAIRARRWILDKNGVAIIVNMYRGSEGRSIGEKTWKIIYKHTTESMKAKLKKNCLKISIDVDNFNKDTRKTCVEKILNHCNDKSRLLFLVDETYVQSYWQDVYNMLIKDFTESHIWLAGLYGGRPDNFDNMTLTEVMRCPPNVQKVLQNIDWIQERIRSYSIDSTKTDMATDGADVMVMLHKHHSEPSLHPAQCGECGEDLAAYLENNLNVCQSGKKKEDLPADLQINSLTCQDIVLLINLPRNLYTVNNEGHLDTNEKCYQEYMKLVESSPLIKKLGENGFPTKVHTTLPLWELAKGKEEVIHVSWVFSYQGLENKVVIFLPAGPAMLKQELLDKMTEKERKIWEDPVTNIPCPGLIGRYSDKWDSSVKCYSSFEFQQTNVDNAFDPDINIGFNGDHTHRGSLGFSTSVMSEEEEEGGCIGGDGDYRRRGSTITKFSDRVRKWRVRDLNRYHRWDKNTLFISASRCTAQLFMILP